MEIRCGAPTKRGTPCRWERSRCPVHQQGAAQTAPAPEGPQRPGLAPPDSLEGQDLRGLAWWVIGRVITGELPPAGGSVISSIMRTLASLGPAELEESAALREVALRGVLMHGIPPRTPEEWALAESIFDDDAIAEFRRWKPLGDGDEGG